MISMFSPDSGEWFKLVKHNAPEKQELLLSYAINNRGLLWNASRSIYFNYHLFAFEHQQINMKCKIELL